MSKDKFTKEEREEKLAEYFALKNILGVYMLVYTSLKLANQVYPLHSLLRNPKFQLLIAIGLSFGVYAINEKQWDKGSEIFASKILPVLAIALCNALVLSHFFPNMNKIMLGSLSVLVGAITEASFEFSENYSPDDYNVKYANRIVKSAFEIFAITTIAMMVYNDAVSIQDSLVFSACWLALKELIDFGNYQAHKNQGFAQAALNGKNPLDPEKAVHSFLFAQKAKPSNLPIGKTASVVFSDSPLIA